MVTHWAVSLVPNIRLRLCEKIQNTKSFFKLIPAEEVEYLVHVGTGLEFRVVLLEGVSQRDHCS